MIKKILTITLTLSLAIGLFAGCGCSNLNKVTEEEKDQKRQDVQKILTSCKMPFIIKRDEKAFELTETQTTIALQNKTKTKDKGSIFIFDYMKWNQEQEDNKDNNIRKNIENSQKLVAKLPTFKRGKIKKINKKTMYVQHRKIKKGKYKGMYGAEITFRDEDNKNNKQNLLVYLITRNKKTIKQIKKFTKKFLQYDAKRKNQNDVKIEEETTKDLFDLGSY